MDNPQQAPAIGYSVVSNLPGDRQVTMQCFISEGESDAAVHARLDRMMGFVDRQKARYELVDLEEELVKRQEGRDLFEHDLENVKRTHAEKLAMLDVQMLTIRQDAEATRKAAYDAWSIASGRRGAFKPQGADKQKIDRCSEAIAALEAEKTKMVAERDQHIDNVHHSIEHHKKGIAKTQDLIALKRRFLEGG